MDNNIAESIRRNDLQALKDLIAQLSGPDKQKTLDNALFLASSTATASVNLLKLLLEYGANPNTTHKRTRSSYTTPLISAVLSHRSLEPIELLLQRGVLFQCLV